MGADEFATEKRCRITWIHTITRSVVHSRVALCLKCGRGHTGVLCSSRSEDVDTCLVVSFCSSACWVTLHVFAAERRLLNCFGIFFCMTLPDSVGSFSNMSRIKTSSYLNIFLLPLITESTSGLMVETSWSEFCSKHSIYLSGCNPLTKILTAVSSLCYLSFTVIF